MQERSIWLLDASIVGLTLIKQKKVKKEIIKICWGSHIAPVIKESIPKCIMIIGTSTVGDALSSELERFNTHLEIMQQPRGQGIGYFEKFEGICKRHC